MVMKFLYSLAIAGLLLIGQPLAFSAQQPCAPPTPKSLAQGLCFFTQAQEVELGEAVAEHLQRDFRIIEDEAVTAYLQRIGERIIRHLPPNELRFRFFLVELPEANAFVLPGGRIYISRKMVAFTQSEDELAGVISHEIGHLIARQQAIEMSRLMKEVLGVNGVGDRKDIFDKYNLLMDNIGRKPKALRNDSNREDADQIEADQIGLFALAAAGYDPQAHARLFDRFAETRGKTGGFFSNLFGTTKPEQKRLRELLRGVASLPAGCVEARAKETAADYRKWQSAVVAYTGIGKRESLRGVLAKTVLEPPLRGEINHLRFSPDGRYVLAQDDSGITVLSREPFKSLFRIHAIEAQPAHFTPDSQSLVFYTTDLRIEVWNVAEQSLKEAYEMVLRKALLQTELSPDGRQMACLDGDWSLCLYDVATGELLFQKKGFYEPSAIDVLNMSFSNLWSSLVNDEELEDVEWVQMKFSPDGRFLAAGRRGIDVTLMGTLAQTNTAILVDVKARAALPMKGQMKTLLASGFAFIGNDRLLGFNPQEPQKSAILSLPGGEVVEPLPLNQFRMANSSFTGATRGSYLMVRPAGQYAAGVMNLTTKAFTIGSKTRALDIYDNVYVSERLNGELGLYSTEKNEVKAVVVLPPNQLGRLRATAVSPDFDWLAVSERSRGAVWNVKRGERVMHIRGFRGGAVADDGHLYADFPKAGDSERSLGRIKMASREAESVTELKGRRTFQYGKYVLTTKPAKKDGDYDKDVVVEVHDVQDFKLLWTKPFAKEAPSIRVSSVHETMTLVWAVNSKAAQEIIKADAALKQRLATMKEKEGDYLLQVVDARTGKLKGNLLIETGKGSFRIASVFAAADWVVIADSENRVLVYALSTGEQHGKVFGAQAIVSPDGDLLGVENESGQLLLYQLATLERRAPYIFTAPVSLARFSRDGKKLFVLTADQVAYVLDVTQKS